MTLRSLLLAGTVLPLTMGQPTLALDRALSRTIPLQLAQVEEACPEGQECPPPLEGTQPMPEAAPEQAPQPEMEAAPPEEPIMEGAPPEQAPPAIEEAPPEQAPPEPEMETAPAPEIIEEAPAEQAPPSEEPVIEPERPEQLPQPEIAPQPEGEGTTIELGPPEQAPPAAETGTQPPELESTTEQQLEAQGDDEEASRVRNLRSRLLDQLQGVLDPAGEPGNRRRGYDRRYDEGDVVDRRGGGVIIDLGGGNIYIEPEVPDDDRLLYDADNVEVQELEGGRTRTIVYRRNGVQIVTVRDRYGDIIRRVKVLPDGRQIVLIDNRFPEGYDPRRQRILRDVPPPIIGIPRDQYVVDLGNASYDDIRGALLAPPVQGMERRYTLDEVLRNESVRAYSPRIDLDTITFEFGSSTIGNDQMRSIFELGQALEDVLREHPDEVYLIEGHTDLVGSNYDNLILSDRRSEAVAVALSQNFAIPPENLITQGYGEEYPKVATDGPERRNRRATVRRVTELLQAQNQ